jgi:hypothetical protein
MEGRNAFSVLLNTRTAKAKITAYTISAVSLAIAFRLVPG